MNMEWQRKQQIDEADRLELSTAPLVKALEKWLDAKREMVRKPQDVKARSAFWKETDRLDRSFAKWIDGA